MQKPASLDPFPSITRFEVVRPLGRGATGMVYEAIDRESGARVALKTLHATTPEALLLLKNESRQLQDLAHPALVTPRELFEQSGEWFFSMDLVEGRDFLSYVRTGPEGLAAELGFDEPRLRAALAQLADGLSVLHSDHKVHRDIKPSNVLVEPDGRVRILDFGIVRSVGKEADRDPDDEGVVVGTVSYMAPEQAAGEVVTPAADWYAVGAMVYEALTGRTPFVGSIDDIFAQKWAGDPLPPRGRNARVPEDLNQLCVDLLRRDPALRLEGSELLQRLGVARSGRTKAFRETGRFVGRRDELAQMVEALEEARTGHAVTLFVEGDSGVGKSTLVREFTREATATHGARLFHGRCYERESLPFKAVDSVIDQVARYLARVGSSEVRALLPEGAAVLRTVFPVLELVPALSGAIPTHLDGLGPQERRSEMFALVRVLIGNLARTGTLILAIDDLQWADADSFGLLSELFRGPDAPAIMLIGSIRGTSMPEPAGGAVRERLLQFPGSVRWIHLGPLPSDDARTLVRNLLGRDGETLQAVDAICAEARGHPLFIDALVRQRDARTQSTSFRLDDALWGRIAHLSPDDRALMEVIAVAGVPIPQHVIARAAALDFAVVFEAMGTLRSEHLVRTSGAHRRDTAEAYHDRVRESVLARVSPSAQKWWHRRLATALEDLGYDEPEKLMVHWLGADERGHAAGHAVRAADVASKALAFDHAATLYRLAIDAQVHSDDALRALHAKLGDALASAAGHHPSGAPVARAAAGAGPAGALVLRARAAEQSVQTGRGGPDLATLGELLSAIGIRLPATGWRGRFQLFVLRCLRRLRGFDYRERDASEIPTSALEVLDVCWTLAAALEAIDGVRGAVLKARYVALALRVGEASHVARALSVDAARVALDGERAWPQTIELIERASDLGARSNRPDVTALAFFTRGIALHLSGKYALAAPWLQEALRVSENDRSALKWEIATAQRYLLTSLFWSGRLPELCRLQPAFLREAQDRRDLHTAFLLRGGHRSFVHLVADEPHLVMAQLEERRDEWRPAGHTTEHLDSLVATTGVMLYVGQGARALAALDERWPVILWTRLLQVEVARIWLYCDHGRAALASAETDPARAPTLFPIVERDVRALETEPAIWARALGAFLRAGLVRVRDRDEAHARSLLEHAISSFEAEGLALHAAAAKRCLGVVAGGPQGASFIEGADAWMTERGVRRPIRLAAMLAPGFFGSAGTRG